MIRRRYFNHNILLITGLILLIALSSCVAQKKGHNGMSMPRKKKPKKCDCPKWTQEIPPDTYKLEWHA